MSKPNTASSSNREDIPDLDLCFCDKLVVEKICWFDENAGRKMVACPDGWNGCAYSRWVEPPQEPRAVAVIQKLLKEMNDLKRKHSMEKSKIYAKHSEKIKKLKLLIESVPTESEDDSENED